TSVNKMYIRYIDKVVLSNEARVYKEYAQLTAKSQWQAEPLECDITVMYYFYGSKLDADNGLKILNDAMNRIIWKDDRQILEMHVYIDRTKTSDPRVEVEVHRLRGSK